MSQLPTIDMKDMNDTLISIDEIAGIVGQTKLTVQKKINTAKLETVAMLRTGKPGRPSRLFNRSEVNAIFNLSASPAISTKENQSTKIENNQTGNMARQDVSASP